MKRAQFAPGFPELRGNVSGKQNLEYPTDNLGAYEGPIGSVNYARNYKAAVVVSQRAKDGKFFFSIRKRTANHLTAKSKKAMALLGGAGAIYAALLKATALKAQAEAVWAKAVELGDKRSFREFMMWYIRQGLINHVETITLTVAGSTVSIDNPWGKLEGVLNITIAQDVRIKFWNELVDEGSIFYLNGTTGMSSSGNTFSGIEETNYNIFGLKAASGKVRTDNGTGAWVTLNGAYVLESDTIGAGVKYQTTSEAPTI